MPFVVYSVVFDCPCDGERVERERVWEGRKEGGERPENVRTRDRGDMAPVRTWFPVRLTPTGNHSSSSSADDDDDVVAALYRARAGFFACRCFFRGML